MTTVLNQNWLKRRGDRQHDLERGIDVDLVRDNLKTERCPSTWDGRDSAHFAARYIPRPAWARSVLAAGTVRCFAFGFILSKWASQERAFLDMPDPKEPVKLFKF
jgi:hypothetical protein